MNLARERLLDLIGYVEATEQDKLKTVFDISDHRGFLRDEAALAELPSVGLNQVRADDVVWLSVGRLAKKPPPEPDSLELQPWLSLRDNPTVSPSLSAELLAESLVTAGLIDGGETPASIRLDEYQGAAGVRAAFDAYVAGPWSNWSAEEAPRRQTIALYNALFALRSALEGGVETPVEIVCGIGLSSVVQAGKRMRYPLLTVQLEIALNQDTHAIELRPRLETQPGLEADVLDKMELSSVDEWRRYAQDFLGALEDEPLSPFAPESYEPVLRRAVELLAPDAHYLPDERSSADRSLPTMESRLQVSDVFAFFQRERRATQLMEDLRRFRTLIESDPDGKELPGAVRAVVTEPAAGPSNEDYPRFRGVSTIPGVTSSDGSGKDLFFPKPFNREQVEVVQRLALRPGVVVQGPPGTGKTHTIANIISHYLALGKRVLVTSQKAPALKVLRDQLPKAIRPLAVSLLDSDRDGLKQFRESIDVIADGLQRNHRATLEREIKELDGRIDRLHRALARIDHEVDDIGRNAISTLVLDGEHLEPVKAAREFVANRAAADWITDSIDVTPAFDLRFSDEDIVALRQARKELGADITYLDVDIPRPEETPGDDELLAVHRDLSQAETLRRRIADGGLLDLIDRGAETMERASALLARLRDLHSERALLSEAPFGWTHEVALTLRGPTTDWEIDDLEGLRSEAELLVSEARHFRTRPVTPSDISADTPLRAAIDRLAAGRPALGMVAGLTQSKVKARIASIRIIGEPPTTRAAWAEVRRWLDAETRARRLKLSWDHATAGGRLDQTNADGLKVAASITAQLEHMRRIRDHVALERGCDRSLRDLLPRWAGTVAGNAHSTGSAIETLEAHLLRERLDRAEALRRRLAGSLRGRGGEISESLRDFVANALGDPSVSDAEFREAWNARRRRLDDLWAKNGALETVKRVTGLVRKSGAPGWAHGLRTMPVAGVEDELTPGDWQTRWRLRRLSVWLSRIDRHDRLRTLGDERVESEEALRAAYERSIELRTWLQLKAKASDGVQAALAAYATAVRRIGRGTGKSAARYRREAREASDRAKDALPCWIMPHYRVSESLPAALGLFDLVVVDEASQSTLAALPALLRAQQILIVGDDRQVSPDLVGRNQARADELAKRHLADQVVDFRGALREEQSLYDLGTVVFAGGAIMLTEHFRCVAPIIEFSKAQFYNHRLQPLRLPKASERLDPPLVDIFVEDGYRKGMTNLPEADCVVSEIRKITSDEAMARRSIGVTTLLGQEQASLIYSRIEQEIGTELIERHQIRVGDPTTFQGDERDIMFLSLVAEATDTPLSGIRFEQRFNVAASRAKDRMILVRSVELDDLRASDKLRRALLEHFRAPFAADSQSTLDRRSRCESDFERDMFDALSERGFRLDTQVRVGNFRIDLVVEGDLDRRLAIECDGDRWHGPDRWPEDMARQRVLERAGWEVWRCFASRFIREREAVIAELVQLLSARGIAAIGSGEGWTSRHCESRRWCSGGEPSKRGEPVEAPVSNPAGASLSRRLGPERSTPARSAPPPDEAANLGAHTASPTPTNASNETDDVARLLADRRRLSPAEANEVLTRYRMEVVDRDYPGAEPDRCILRPEIIQALLDNGCEDRDDFLKVVPEWMRTSIDRRKLRYLDDIIEILSFVDETSTPKAEPRAKIDNALPAAQSQPLFADEPVVAWTPYKESVLSQKLPSNFPDGHLSPVISAVVDVVRQEGPVHATEIARRLVRRAGLERVTNRVQDTIDSALELAKKTGALKSTGSFWQLTGQADMRPRSRHGASVTLRRIDYLPPREIQEGVRVVRSAHPDIAREKLVELVARGFGYERITVDIRHAISAEAERVLK